MIFFLLLVIKIKFCSLINFVIKRVLKQNNKIKFDLFFLAVVVVVVDLVK
jgi:hypothetical protein